MELAERREKRAGANKQSPPELSVGGVSQAKGDESWGEQAKGGRGGKHTGESCYLGKTIPELIFSYSYKSAALARTSVPNTCKFCAYVAHTRKSRLIATPNKA